MFGACKVCQEKDKTIQSLKDEIQFLRNFIRPKHNSITPTDLEFNAIASGHEHVIEVPVPQVPAKTREQEEIDAEASRILSGTY